MRVMLSSAAGRGLSPWRMEKDRPILVTWRASAMRLYETAFKTAVCGLPSNPRTPAPRPSPAPGAGEGQGQGIRGYKVGNPGSHSVTAEAFWSNAAMPYILRPPAVMAARPDSH